MIPSFTADVIANLLQSEKYSDNQDVMVEILEVLHVIVKELIEALPGCTSDVNDGMME